MPDKELEQRVAALEAQVSMLSKMVMSVGQQGAIGPAGLTDDAAFRAVAEMSQRQVATLLMVLEGYKLARVAERFGVSESTAKIYVTGAMRRLGASSRAQMIIKAREIMGVLDDKQWLEACGIPKDFGKHLSKYAKFNVASLKDRR